MSEFPLPVFKRPSTRISKRDVTEQYGVEPVYRMMFNESPLGPSPKVVAAIQEEAAKIGEYPTLGDERLREALAQTWGHFMTANHFFTACSGSETLELVTRAYLQADDEVMITPPTFGMYNRLTEVQKAKIVSVPLKQPSFTPDVEAILSAVTPRTRLLILCNPNNPTGTVMPAAEMDDLVKNMPEHVTIVADDVYCHFVTDKDYPDNVQYIAEGYPVIRIQTFSKAYGMAGLRLGYGIAPPKIANYIGGLHRGFHQSRLALAAGLAALEDQEHMQKNVQMVVEGREWLYGQLDRLDLAYIPSQTNFMIVHLPPSRDANEVVNALLPYGVIVRALNAPGLENSLRVSTSVPAGNEQFIRGLEEILTV